jgi:hypothetical protein
MRDARSHTWLSSVGKLSGAQGRKKTAKLLEIFGVDESNIQLWWKHKAAISECGAS